MPKREGSLDMKGILGFATATVKTRPDILMLTLRIDTGEMHFAIDRRMCGMLIQALQEGSQKLTAPRREN